MNISLKKNLTSGFGLLEEAGYIYRYPMGEKYETTRKDCETDIAGVC